VPPRNPSSFTRNYEYGTLATCVYFRPVGALHEPDSLGRPGISKNHEMWTLHLLIQSLDPALQLYTKDMMSYFLHVSTMNFLRQRCYCS